MNIGTFHVGDMCVVSMFGAMQCVCTYLPEIHTVTNMQHKVIFTLIFCARCTKVATGCEDDSALRLFPGGNTGGILSSCRLLYHIIIIFTCIVCKLGT